MFRLTDCDCAQCYSLLTIAKQTQDKRYGDGTRLHVYAFDISDTALSWFRSFLFECTQVVSVNGNSSSASVMKFGIPLGSVLGPILFVLDTQPLSDIVHCHSLSYHSLSDDNQLYKSGHVLQLQDIIQSTQCCISYLKDWMTNNKLQLNKNKTDMIFISPRIELNNEHFQNVPKRH